ncbi:MAG TPA: hypothetical protein VGK74_15245 [Symbiobacteriaceae bacterium]|jgi:hypothetical protein
MIGNNRNPRIRIEINGTRQITPAQNRKRWRTPEQHGARWEKEDQVAENGQNDGAGNSSKLSAPIHS